MDWMIELVAAIVLTGITGSFWRRKLMKKNRIRAVIHLFYFKQVNHCLWHCYPESSGGCRYPAAPLEDLQKALIEQLYDMWEMF